MHNIIFKAVRGETTARKLSRDEFKSFIETIVDHVKYRILITGGLTIASPFCASVVINKIEKNIFKLLPTSCSLDEFKSSLPLSDHTIGSILSVWLAVLVIPSMFFWYSTSSFCLRKTKRLKDVRQARTEQSRPEEAESDDLDCLRSAWYWM